MSVSNLPATQGVSGTVSVGNLPATQPVSGTVSVGNLPATQPVSGTVDVGNAPVVHCLTGADAECRSTVVDGLDASEANPVFVKTAGDGGTAFKEARTEVLYGLALLLFLGNAAWWSWIGRGRRRRIGRV